MTSDFTWFPTNSSQLQFSSCFEAVALWSFYDFTISQKYSDRETSFFDVNTHRSQIGQIATSYAFDGLGINTYDRQPGWPSESEVWEWMKQPIAENTISGYVRIQCSDERCMLLGWDNDPDVTGVGASFAHSTFGNMLTVTDDNNIHLASSSDHSVRVDTSCRSQWHCPQAHSQPTLVVSPRPRYTALHNHAPLRVFLVLCRHAPRSHE
jgi:hypothetical protein